MSAFAQENLITQLAMLHAKKIAEKIQLSMTISIKAISEALSSLEELGKSQPVDSDSKKYKEALKKYRESMESLKYYITEMYEMSDGFLSLTYVSRFGEESLNELKANDEEYKKLLEELKTKHHMSDSDLTIKLEEKSIAGGILRKVFTDAFPTNDHLIKLKTSPSFNANQIQQVEELRKKAEELEVKYQNIISKNSYKETTEILSFDTKAKKAYITLRNLLVLLKSMKGNAEYAYLNTNIEEGLSHCTETIENIEKAARDYKKSNQNDAQKQILIESIKNATEPASKIAHVIQDQLPKLDKLYYVFEKIVELLNSFMTLARPEKGLYSHFESIKSHMKSANVGPAPVEDKGLNLADPKDKTKFDDKTKPKT